MNSKIIRCIVNVLCTYQNYVKHHCVEYEDEFGEIHNYINCDILSRYIAMSTTEAKEYYYSTICEFLIDGMFCRINEYICSQGINIDFSKYNLDFLIDNSQIKVIDAENFLQYLEGMKVVSEKEFQTFGDNA